MRPTLATFLVARVGENHHPPQIPRSRQPVSARSAANLLLLFTRATHIPGDALILGIDTCGPSGSVALARLTGPGIELLGQTELAGRTYSATLITAIADLLARANAAPARLHAIVAVNGPGSFTGVRVGLSAAKGLAEAGSIGIVPVSRLEVLARKAQVPTAALDAHRNEIFLRLAGPGRETAELLAGREELAVVVPAPAEIAVCDDAAATLLASEWPTVQLHRAQPPTAADALTLCAPRIAAGDFANVAHLDGHYLRRSDAEIFGEPGAPPRPR
jgi:tRNA threonylcarbamoyladenosine biosynthesis protein TsaB